MGPRRPDKRYLNGSLADCMMRSVSFLHILLQGGKRGMMCYSHMSLDHKNVCTCANNIQALRPL